MNATVTSFNALSQCLSVEMMGEIMKNLSRQQPISWPNRIVQHNAWDDQ